MTWQGVNFGVVVRGLVLLAGGDRALD